MPGPFFFVRKTHMFTRTLKRFSRAIKAGLAGLALFAGASVASAQDTVKIGILHSLSGTMAISETSLRDVVLMAADEINAAGGVKVGGKAYKIQPEVV